MVFVRRTLKSAVRCRKADIASVRLKIIVDRPPVLVNAKVTSISVKT